MPFQTAVPPPPRNVGTPLSADTPAPVNTKTARAERRRSRTSSSMLRSLFAGIETSAMVAERGKKSKVKRQKAKEEDEQPYKPEKFCARSAPALLPFAFLLLDRKRG